MFIKSVGIDAVEVARMEKWVKFPERTLLRIFSPAEIAYAFAQPRFTAQRLAVRFAAREALYKALSQAYPDCAKPGVALREAWVPFLTLCRTVEVVQKNNGAPYFSIDHEHLELPHFETLLSLTHTNTVAMAYVAVGTER